MTSSMFSPQLPSAFTSPLSALDRFGGFGADAADLVLEQQAVRYRVLVGVFQP